MSGLPTPDLARRESQAQANKRVGSVVRVYEWCHNSAPTSVRSIDLAPSASRNYDAAYLRAVHVDQWTGGGIRGTSKLQFDQARLAVAVLDGHGQWHNITGKLAGNAFDHCLDQYGVLGVVQEVAVRAVTNKPPPPRPPAAVVVVHKPPPPPVVVVSTIGSPLAPPATSDGGGGSSSTTGPATFTPPPVYLPLAPAPAPGMSSTDTYLMYGGAACVCVLLLGAVAYAMSSSSSSAATADPSQDDGSDYGSSGY